MFFFIFIIFLILGYAIYTSRLQIEVKNLKIDTEMPKGQKVNKESNIYIYLLIFKKIKIFKRDIKNQEINFKKQNIDLSIFKEKDLLQKPDINIEKIDLNVQLSTQDAALTAILAGILGARIWCIVEKAKI